ncbi:MAG: type II toxin-antitoxin system RelE/ParE family toxin [Firmicutes bacterium]|nr:type II toxin-antitoxin system RelE/ParE family toxin [Bacillota bacterium]
MHAMVPIKFLPQAAQDFGDLDASVQEEVQKALAKLEREPKAFGSPLGERAGIDLHGLFSIRAGRRIRVIYRLQDDPPEVIILAVGKRDRFLAHKSARDRLRAITEATREELLQLQAVLKAADAS